MAVCYKKMQLVISFFPPSVRSLWDLSAFYDYIKVTQQAKKSERNGLKPFKNELFSNNFFIFKSFFNNNGIFFVTF